MGDKYDDAIVYLRSSYRFMHEVEAAWHAPSSHPAGCLFQYVTPTGRPGRRASRDDSDCGCLTHIRHDCVLQETGPYVAWTDELTREIGADDRIPLTPRKVTPENLEVFAEWQRRLDVEIRGVAV